MTAPVNGFQNCFKVSIIKTFLFAVVFKVATQFDNCSAYNLCDLNNHN